MDEKTDNKVDNKTDEPGSKSDEGKADTVDKSPKEPEVNPLDEAKEINKETAKLNAERTKILEREEKLHAEKMVGGRGQVIPKAEIKSQTEKEYAEAMERGEVDPFKADGY